MLKDVLTQLGTTSVVIAIAGYLFKTWIAHQLEKLKTQNAHELSLKLETARAEWAKDVARLNVHESYLHKKRGNRSVPSFEDD
jgi:phage repressor protein C with HTH and peptisase S24 domain